MAVLSSRLSSFCWLMLIQISCCMTSKRDLSSWSNYGTCTWCNISDHSVHVLVVTLVMQAWSSSQFVAAIQYYVHMLGSWFCTIVLHFQSDTTCCLEKWLYIWIVCGCTCTWRPREEQDGLLLNCVCWITAKKTDCFTETMHNIHVHVQYMDKVLQVNTIFLLKFGTSSYSTPSTKWCKIHAVSNFRQRSSHICCKRA